MPLHERSNSVLKQSLVNENKANGAVCIRPLLRDNEIELVRQGIEYNLQNPSSRFKVASYEKKSGKVAVTRGASNRSFERFSSSMKVRPLMKF